MTTKIFSVTIIYVKKIIYNSNIFIDCLCAFCGYFVGHIVKRLSQFKILSPCGILGYGFPDDSFELGLKEKPDAIVVDAGSTDAGPHKLGKGVAIVSKTACKKDLYRIIEGANRLDIPVIIGSAGGSGARVHIDWTLTIIDEIFRENNLKPVKQAVIYADIAKNVVRDYLENDRIHPLGNNIPNLTKERLDETTDIVAQMGVEPIIDALEEGAKLIVCGRAYDPAPFAAVAMHAGFDKALAYHLGKILECGALCCDVGTTKDCMIGVLFENHFQVYPTNPKRICTSVSVAAHTFYEKDHPYILHGPGITLNLSKCTFEEVDGGKVNVFGSDIENVTDYTIKLEGARVAAYRTFVIAGIREPLLIENIECIEEEVKKSIAEQYKEINASHYSINFYNYGKDGVMGESEPCKQLPHEIGVLFEVIAKTQELASTICSSVRSTFLHYGYEGRKSTAGNLAFPFAPSDIEFGEVYEFSVYHLMSVTNPCEFFPIKYSVQGGKN